MRRTQRQLKAARLVKEREDEKQKVASHLFWLSERSKRAMLLNYYREMQRMLATDKDGMQ